MNNFKILERDDLGALASPFRRKLLEDLTESPESASSIARRHEISRQRVGYHMRALEKSGYIEPVEERQSRGLTERLYQARSFAYVHASAEPDRPANSDRYSWATLLNATARSLFELITLRKLADRNQQRLATLSLETEMTFTSPARRKAFTEDLLTTVQQVVERHNQSSASDGRQFKLLIGAYPLLKQEIEHD